MSQELNLKNIFRAEQVRLKPFYDLQSYKRELVYAFDVLGIHIGRIGDVMEARWHPEKANEEFAELITEIRGLSRTELEETAERERPAMLQVLIDKERAETPTPSRGRRGALQDFYTRTIEKIVDPKDRIIFIQSFAALDESEGRRMFNLYTDDFEDALLQYKEANGDE